MIKKIETDLNMDCFKSLNWGAVVCHPPLKSL